MGNNRWVLGRRCLLLAAALAWLLSACADDAKDATARPGAGAGSRAATMVNTQRVQLQTFSEIVRATGTVQARESITVTSKVSEVIERVHFESGQQVRRGQALVTLSGQQQYAALREAQAAADEAQRLLERQQQLAAQQLIARAQLDTQRAVRDSTRARVAQIQAQLSERVIRAPFSGVLGIREVSAGALITPGTVITTLDDIAEVYVDFPLPELYLAQLHNGQRLRGHTVVWPDAVFEGQVDTIEPRIDPNTRALRVRARFANPNQRLRPGMLVNVELFQAQRQALLVPEIAVVQVGQESFVWKVDNDNKVSQASVSIGARIDGKAEITAGVQAGDRIVVDGTGKLRQGMTVSDGAAGMDATAPARVTDTGAEG